MTEKAQLFCFKIHKASGKSILAVCDAGVIGRTIKFGKVDFHVSCAFYGSEKTGDEDIVARVRDADIVRLLLKNGLVREESVLWMGDTPHVQIVRL